MGLNSNLKAILLTTLFGLLLVACGGQDGLNISDKAPDFSLPSTSGETISLSDYEGKTPVLLYFHMAVG